MHKPDDILIFLPNWVGDVVMATPSLRALRAGYPEARITWLGRKIALDTLAGSPWCDGRIVDDTRGQARRTFELVRTIRRGGFDLAVLLTNSFRTAALARLGGVARRAGYSRDGRGWLLTDRAWPIRDSNGRFVPVSAIDYYNALVAGLGVSPPDRRMELAVSQADARRADQLLAEAGRDDDTPLVLLNPGASFGPSKMWPPDRFAAVADRLAESRNAQVIINAAPAEKPIAATVAAHMKHKPLLDFSQRDNTLGLLKALISRSALVITNDTGPRHFAAALGTGLVTVFGSTDPAWARIDYPRERIVRVDVPCGPCQKKLCPLPAGAGHHQCMEKITPAMVVEAAMELLPAEAPRSEGAGR